jgi:hypothetical protein
MMQNRSQNQKRIRELEFTAGEGLDTENELESENRRPNTKHKQLKITPIGRKLKGKNEGHKQDPKTDFSIAIQTRFQL